MFPFGSTVPQLLAFQQLVIGGDLNIQGQLEVHQLLVLSDLAGQVMLGAPQGLLQLGDVLVGPLQAFVTFHDCIIDVFLQRFFLQAKEYANDCTPCHKFTLSRHSSLYETLERTCERCRLYLYFDQTLFLYLYIYLSVSTFTTSGHQPFF